MSQGAVQFDTNIKKSHWLQPITHNELYILLMYAIPLSHEPVLWCTPPGMGREQVIWYYLCSMIIWIALITYAGFHIMHGIKCISHITVTQQWLQVVPLSLHNWLNPLIGKTWHNNEKATSKLIRCFSEIDWILMIVAEHWLSDFNRFQ